jgi:hypothetical protein
MQNSTKSFQYAIWNEGTDRVPLQFMETILLGLKEEINLALEHFPISENPNYKDQSMFYWLLVEMSWLNLWNNAIIRKYGTRVSTLREISIYEGEKKYIGRPDLLVSLKEKDSHVHFLFEGKMDEWNGNWKPKDESAEMEKYYNDVYSQASKYKDHLSSGMINNYQPYIVPITFEWMRSPQAIESAKEFFHDLHLDRQTQFCALYSHMNSGMWVYGKIFSQK